MSGWLYPVKGENALKVADSQEHLLFADSSKSKHAFPPSLSCPQVPRVGQRHQDAFHVYFIVRKRTLCPGICFVLLCL